MDVDDILSENVDLVYACAKRMASRVGTQPAYDYDDMCQEGFIGLMDAASRYSNVDGAKFRTYASIRIYGRMMDAFREISWVKRRGYKSQNKIRLFFSTLDDKFASKSNDFENIDLCIDLENLLSSLTNLERETMVSLFIEEKTLSELARERGVTPTAIFDIKTRSKNKIENVSKVNKYL